MKKNVLALCAATTLLSFTACNSDDAPALENRFSYDVYNLFSPMAPGMASFASESTYQFHLVAEPKMDMTTNCEDLTFDNSSHSLTIPTVKFEVLQFADGQYITFESSKGSINGQNGVVRDFKCVLSELYYKIPGRIPTVNGVGSYHNAVIAQYKIGNIYEVATFPSDATYRGVTSTSFEYQGHNQVYKTKAGSYRVVMNLTTMKADVVLYNVKFAEQSPALVLVLKDLDINLENNAYSITGANLNPNQVEGNALTVNDSFPFESFRLRTVSEDLATVSIEYTVRNKIAEDKIGNGEKVYYYGSFTGSYVNDPKNPFNPDTPVE